MSFLDRVGAAWNGLRGRPEVVVARENPVQYIIYEDSLDYGEEAQPRTQNFEDMLLQADTLATIASCINKLVSLASAVPLYECDARTGERLDDPKISGANGRPLLYQPNTRDGVTAFLQRSYQQLALMGNLVQCADYSMMDPRGLWVHEFDRCKLVPNQDNAYPFSGYWYHGKRRKEFIEAERMILTQRPNPRDPIYGLSFLRQAQDAIERLWLSNDLNRNLMKRGGRSGGFLIVKGGIGDRERDKLTKQLNARFGAKNAGKVVVLSAEDGDFKPDNSAPKDMEYSSTVLETKLEIYNVFGFMPALFATRDVNRSNLEDAKASAYSDTVKPFVELMVDAWNASPMTKAAGVYVCADWDAIPELQTDRKAEAETWAVYLDRDVVTPNEVREKLGFDSPLEGGDETLGARRAASAALMAQAQIEAASRRPDPPEAPDDDDDDEDQDRGGGVGARRANWGAGLSAPAVPPPARPVPVGRDAGSPTFEMAVADALATQPGCCSPLRRAEILRAGAPRDRAWLQASDAMDAREGVWARKMRGLYDDLEREVMGNLRGALDEVRQGVTPDGDVVRADAPVIPAGWTTRAWFDQQALMRKWEEELLAVAAEDAQAGADFAWAALNREGVAGLGSEAFQDFVNTRLARNVKEMTATQASSLAAVIDRMSSEGRLVSEIADELAEKFSWDRRVRAQLVAQTEVTAYFQKGSEEGMREAGVERHEWLTSRDSRVRASHARADGQTVRLGEDFVLTDDDGRTSRGAGPGLMDAAWANARCRCTTLPVLEEAA